MKPIDILLLILLAAAVFLAVRSIHRTRKQGCGCGCAGCSRRADCGKKTDGAGPG